MRFTLCVLICAVSLLLCDCTATANEGDVNVRQDSNVQTEGVVTTTTTTAPKIISQPQSQTLEEHVQLSPVDPGPENELERAPAARGVNTLGEEKGEEEEEEAAAADEVPEVINNAVPEHKQQAQSPQQTEVKTTTTTAEVNNLSGPKAEKVQDQSPQSNAGKEPHLEVNNAVVSAKTATTASPTPEKTESGVPLTTTSTVDSTKVQSTAMTTTSSKGSNIPQSVTNKDISSSESLLFAFAALVTLGVMVVAPVY